MKIHNKSEAQELVAIEQKIEGCMGESTFIKERGFFLEFSYVNEHMRKNFFISIA